MSCPICGRPTLPDRRPFCSRRCADVDLARWFNGSYAIPVAEDEAESTAGETPEKPLDSPGRLV